MNYPLLLSPLSNFSIAIIITIIFYLLLWWHLLIVSYFSIISCYSKVQLLEREKEYVYYICCYFANSLSNYYNFFLLL